MLSNICFDFCMVLCGARSWTWWSLGVPSSSGCSMIWWFYETWGLGKLQYALPLHLLLNPGWYFWAQCVHIKMYTHTHTYLYTYWSRSDLSSTVVRERKGKGPGDVYWQWTFSSSLLKFFSEWYFEVLCGLSCLKFEWASWSPKVPGSLCR